MTERKRTKRLAVRLAAAGARHPWRIARLVVSGLIAEVEEAIAHEPELEFVRYVEHCRNAGWERTYVGYKIVDRCGREVVNVVY